MTVVLVLVFIAVLAAAFFMPLLERLADAGEDRDDELRRQDHGLRQPLDD